MNYFTYFSYICSSSLLFNLKKTVCKMKTLLFLVLAMSALSFASCEHKEAMASKEKQTFQDEITIQHQLGYDYQVVNYNLDCAVYSLQYSFGNMPLAKPTPTSYPLMEGVVKEVVPCANSPT